MSLALILDSVEFHRFEVPEDFGPIGGKQTIVTHEFPGGLITQQELGAFPTPIKWSGYLTGGQAFNRQQAIDQIRVTGQDVQLTYGRYAWLGKVTEFEARAKHKYLVPYSITFEPSQDLSGAAGLVSGGGFSADTELAGETGGLGDVIGGSFGLSLPDVLSDPASALTSALAFGLSNGNGTVAGISFDDATAIQAAVFTAQTSAQLLLASDDPTIASPASDFYAYASNIGATIASPFAPQVVLPQQINPNLFQLAVQYFGDATKWQDIANASGLADPQPIGTFNITIPAT